MNSAVIVFLGTPQFALPSLEVLHRSSHRIGAVVTSPDRRRGRGLKVTYSPVKEFALEKGIRILQPATLKNEDFRSALEEIAPDLIITAAYGKILPPVLLEFPPLGCINLHASFLPAYRGAAPINRAIMEGADKTGITVIKMAAGLDTGDIITQAPEPIYLEDTAGSLHDRLAVKGSRLLLQAVDGLVAGTAVLKAQGAARVSYAPPLKREEEKVNWHTNSWEVYNHIRGLSPYPGAYTGFRGKRLKIIKALPPVSGRYETLPGEVRRIEGDTITVGTAEGQLILEEVQPEGRLVMTAGAFSRGYDIRPGFCFG